MTPYTCDFEIQHTFHIPGKYKIADDYLIRFKFQEAFHVMSQLNQLQTPIPQTSLTI